MTGPTFGRSVEPLLDLAHRSLWFGFLTGFAAGVITAGALMFVLVLSKGG